MTVPPTLSLFELLKAKQLDNGDHLREEAELFGDPVNLTLHFPKGRQLLLKRKLGESVQTVKRHLTDEYDMDFHQIRFMFQGKDMIDPLSLNDYPTIAAEKEADIVVVLVDNIFSEKLLLACNSGDPPALAPVVTSLSSESLRSNTATMHSVASMSSAASESPRTNSESSDSARQQSAPIVTLSLPAMPQSVSHAPPPRSRAVVLEPIASASLLSAPSAAVTTSGIAPTSASRTVSAPVLNTQGRPPQPPVAFAAAASEALVRHDGYAVPPHVKERASRTMPKKLESIYLDEFSRYLRPVTLRFVHGVKTPRRVHVGEYLVRNLGEPVLVTKAALAAHMSAQLQQEVAPERLLLFLGEVELLDPLSLNDYDQIRLHSQADVTVKIVPLGEADAVSKACVLL
eukprot:TRINITY_DN15088_c0_g1_i1.p1 TRINITY_DN15088_c0_g1~~TRINITY_DN15088_c0_g1_i1.p1  ORF type:complete len:401 (+),score=78.77 TRINITY_DN15088_c0_g1_i1:101-1303(+)